MHVVHKAQEESIGSSVEKGFYLKSSVITFTLSCAVQVLTEYLSFIKAWPCLSAFLQQSPTGQLYAA